MTYSWLYRFILLGSSLLLYSCGGADDQQAKKHKRHGRTHLVETMTLGLKTHDFVITRTGTIEARTNTKLFSQEEGLIIKLPVEEGSKVKKGDLLVQLDDALLRAEYNKAVAKRQQAQQNYQRIKRLISRRLVSEDQLARAHTEYKIAQADELLLATRLKHTRILAPHDGIVTRVLFKQNELVAKHKHMLTLVDPASLVVKVRISSLFIPQLKVGDSATLLIDALGARKFNGKIASIHPVVDSQTRQGSLEIALTPIPAGAKSGMFARVSLTTRSAARILIPFSALRSDTRGEYVFVVDAGKAKKRYVRSGERQGETVEIREGLEPGMRLISKGFLGLKPGKKVKSTNQAGQDAAQIVNESNPRR